MGRNILKWHAKATRISTSLNTRRQQVSSTINPLSQGHSDLRSEVGEDQRRDGLGAHPVGAVPRPAAPPDRGKAKEGDGKQKVNDPDEVLGLLGGVFIVVVAGAAGALEDANLALEAGAVPLHAASVGQQKQEVPQEGGKVPGQGGDGQSAVDDAARDPEDESRQREEDNHEAQAGDAMKPELSAAFGGSIMEGGGSNGAIHHVRVERAAVGIGAVGCHDAFQRGMRLIQGVGKRGIAVLVSPKQV